jgi:hypothetical protein
MAPEERRQEPRFAGEVEVLIEIGGGGRSVKGRSKDISKTGIFVLTSEYIAPNMRVGLVMRIPGGTENLAVGGVVVHSRQGIGVGINFRVLSDRAKEQLDLLLERWNAQKGEL